MTVSGGEILTHADFVSRLIDEVGKHGISVCVDTSGYGDSEKLMELVSKKNVVNVLYDMKSIDDEIHRAYTGVSNELIIRNLRMLAADEETRKKIIMRMPLIQGVNDSEEIIRKTGELYREIGIERVNLLTYHNLGIGKKRNLGGIQEEFQPPTEERLEEITRYFEDEIHLQVEILGRV
jgi:pyruvate formate lyase activating enzyme